MSTGEAAHPAVTSMGMYIPRESKFPTVLVSLSNISVIVEHQVPQPLSVRPGQSFCGLLILPQEDLSAPDSSVPVVYKHHSTGLLGGNSGFTWLSETLLFFCFETVDSTGLVITRFQV